MFSFLSWGSWGSSHGIGVISYRLGGHLTVLVSSHTVLGVISWYCCHLIPLWGSSHGIGVIQSWGSSHATMEDTVLESSKAAIG